MMSIENYLNRMKEIQINLLKYLEKDDDIKNYDNLINLIIAHKLFENKYEFKSILYLLLHISNNHYRGPNFFNKIFKIISFISETIKKYFTNFEIFNIFQSNNRIILFLIEEKIIIIDNYIASIIKKSTLNTKYFFNEIKTFLNSKSLQNITKEMPENSDEKRKNGENDNHICELIRNDLIDEFVQFVNETNLDLNSSIEKSIFETNSFLVEKTPTLIEYAAFFGSMNIFNYLYSKRIYIAPYIWFYAIHSKNLQLIQFLIEQKIIPHDFEDFLKESIKCHHFEITKLIKDNYFQNDNINIISTSLKHYNFECIQKYSIDESLFPNLCFYDYFTIVDMLLKTTKIDINMKQVLIYYV